MISRVTHFPIFVKNQDEALSFYTKKLGFKVHTDHEFSGMRWLTICPANQPNLELSLMLAQTPEQINLVGKQADAVPLICFETDDIQKTYDELKQKDVTFADEPKKEPWGTSCTFKDLYGNVLYLVQPNA